jgi:Purple acid Phosphatase, N-terminal domain/Fibronectin type III domain
MQFVMNKLLSYLFAASLAFLSVSPALAAPTQFNSPNYGVESIIFGGTGSLHSIAASIPPVITAGPSVSGITVSAATISWSTDKGSNALVYVGTAPGVYDVQTGDVVDTTKINHSVTLNFLKKGVTYYYKVRSTDISGNAVESPENTFRTDPGDITPPVITTGPIISQTSASTVNVVWETNKLTDSIVQYGIKDVTENSSGNGDELTTFHQISITVQTSQSYQLRVKAKDASGNVAFSPLVPLTTLSSPSITNVQITDVTLSSAVVQWDTGVPSTTHMDYGVTSSYGQKSDDAAYTQSHVVRLTGLPSGSTFHLRLSGKDSSGTNLTSDEYLFKTVILPTISNFKVEAVTSGDVTLSWTSSSEINEFVQYTVINAPDAKLNGTQQGTGKDKLLTTHTFNLSNLDSSTEYSVSVSGNDVFGNKALSDSLTFTTSPDTTPPTIDNLRSDTTVDLGSDQTVQVLVSFGLSEPGKAVINYGPGSNGDADIKTVTTDTQLSTNKFLVIPGLKPGESYHYYIVAKDRAGNEVKSPSYLVLAPKQAASVLGLILGKFQQDFAWLGNLKAGAAQ